MNRNSKLRDRIRDATNEAILAAAEAVLAEEGLYTAKVESIASRAGVSVGTIYNHLGDRDRVLATLLATRKAEVLEKMDAVLQEGEGRPFEEQLEAMLSAIIGHFEQHRRFFAILIQSEGQQEKRIAQAHEAMRAVYERLDALVQRGLHAKVLRPELGDLYGAFLLGMVRSAFMKDLVMSAEPRLLSPRIADLVRFFMQGAGVQHV